MFKNSYIKKLVAQISKNEHFNIKMTDDGSDEFLLIETYNKLITTKEFDLTLPLAKKSFIGFLLKALYYELNGFYLKAFFFYKKSNYNKISTSYSQLNRHNLLRVSNEITTRHRWKNKYDFNIRFSDEKTSIETEFKNNRFFEKVMNRIYYDIDLNNKKVLYMETSSGFITSRLMNSGVDAVGITLSKEDLASAMFYNYIVKRRDRFRHHLYNKVKLIENNDCSNVNVEFDVGILAIDTDSKWEHLTLGEKQKLVTQLIQNSSTVIYLVFPINENNEKLVKELKKLKDEIKIESIRSLHQEKKYYQLSLVKKDFKSETKIPKGIEILKSKSLIVEVDVSKCRDSNGFNYSDWHPFVKVMEQYEKSPNLQYKDSALKFYYDNFQPMNSAERYFLSERLSNSALNEGWMMEPWKPLYSPPVFENRIETRKGGSHHFGPNNNQFIENEFKKLTKLYDTFKENVYEPELFLDGYVSGFFLIKNNDYRFIITEGQHRIAALSLLGYENIQCKLNLNPWTKQIVKYNNVKEFPHVRREVVSSKTARIVFNHFFEENNNEKLLKYLKDKFDKHLN